MNARSFRALAPLALALLLGVGATATAQTAAPASGPTSAPGASGAPSWMLPVSDFARHARLHAPRLSPDGKHLLVRMDDPDGKHHALVVYQLSDMSIVSELNMPIFELPVDPQWVSNDWIALSIGKKMGSLSQPSNTGQVIATNLSGKTQRYLFGWHNGGSDPRARRRGSDDGFGFIAGVPETPDNHLYLRAELFNRGELSILYNINVPHNTRDLLAQLHVSGMSFLVGPAGKAAYAFGDNAKFQYVVYRHEGGNWVKLKPAQVGAYFTPIAFTPDKQHVYAFVDKDGGPVSLVKESLDGSQREELASNKFASVGGIQWTAPPERPFAVIPEAGVPHPIFFNANAPDSKLYRALHKAFPNEIVNFINFDQGGDKLLFGVSSDRDPGTYYLLDTKTFKVRKLFAVAPWINPKQMATRYPFHFKASDGTVLEGILTLPLHRKQQNLPMVLVPHGGPYGIRDTWYFATFAQLLANRGYLVLQVNYRGSGGRGVRFQHAGYRKWGTRIQQDLIDGVKWTIAHHLADPKRICVFGGSFGGYAAMMTVVRAPHLFKCAVGYDGVYDLNMLMDKGNIQSTKSGQSYLDRVLGKTSATRAANSPVNLAAKIDVPVFLAHGKDDHQAPYDGAKEMRAALEAAHKTVEWMAFPHEGHGFYTEQHRAAFYTKLLAFLKKYIGPGAPPTTM